MNRLIRIAITLFISATILILLVRQRLVSIDQLSEEAARNETQMAAVGIIIAGAMAAAGFVLIILTVARSRKRNLPGNE